MAKNRKNDLLLKILICLGLSLFVIVLTQGIIFSFRPLESLEQKHIDERFHNRGKLAFKDSSSSVIILEITENTFKEMPDSIKTWPWPREVFARVIKNLNAAGAKAIGIDILMSKKLQYSQADDDKLADVLREFDNVVMAGKATTNEIVVGNSNSQSGASVSVKNEDFGNAFYNIDSSIGIVQVVPDNDNVIRRYLPFMYSGSANKLLPTFSYALLNKAYKKNKNYLVKNSSVFFTFDSLNSNSKVEIPKFDNTSTLVNYYGPSGTFPHQNFIDVLDDNSFVTKSEADLGAQINTWDDAASGLLFSGKFKDKIVLIGSTMPEDRDIISTSFAEGNKTGDNTMYGVELHANVIQNVISQQFLKKITPVEEIATIIILLFISFWGTALLRDIKSKYNILLEVLGFGLVIGSLILLRLFSFYLFNTHSFVFTLMSAYLSIVLGYFGSTAYYYLTERRQKTAIKGMFSQYVSKAIVDDLINDPSGLKLGGTKMNLTVFFSDLAGFSTFSEKKTPEELVTFLNEYLGAMTNNILHQKGTLDKYIGDAVMAFWGAPIPLTNHAYLACKSALDQQKLVLQLRKKWEEEGQPHINVRMGINTGEMVVGNVGGAQRFDYTVMGDNVNLASRLEGANKPYNTNIMISDSTYELVKDSFITRELDFLVVKGKTKPILVHELISEKGEVLNNDLVKCLQHYKNGMSLYIKREFQEALRYFAMALENKPDDGPSILYVDRCKFYIENPPDADWDRVFKMTTK